VRLIISNEDAERLARLLEANPAALINVETREWVGEGGTVWVTVEGTEVRAKARRTPSAVGLVRIEDLDGRVVWEGYD
jgi:hypothetical protein